MSWLQRIERGARHVGLLGLACILFGVGNQQVSVGARVSNTNFETSWVEVKHVRDEKYTLSFALRNTGRLMSEDTRVSLVLSEDWVYDGAEGAHALVQSKATPYGHLIEWELAPVTEKSGATLRVSILLPEGSRPAPVLMALTSKYSVPVYAELEIVDNAQKTTVSSSWMRSIKAYITLAINEIWYRVSAAARLSLGRN